MSNKSLVQQILEANKQHNKVLTLNELIQAKKNGEISFDVEQPIDRYVYVHVTDFMPEDNKITTNADKEKKGKIDATYGAHVEGRDTVHFTVNGRVLPHSNGSWNLKKYAVVIPSREFVDINNENIISINTEDTIVDGNADISGSFIICPQTDYEEMQKRNPNTVVVPIEAEHAVDVSYNRNKNDDFIHDFIVWVLDLEPKACAQNGWANIYTGGIDSKSIDEYCEIINQYVGKEMPQIQHQFSYTKTLTAIRNGYDFTPSYLREFYQSPEKQNVSLEKMRKIAEEIDRLLAKKDGRSIWFSAYNRYGRDNMSRSIRRTDSQNIDNYLDIDIQDVYDGDIITTNIKRIQMISDKIKSEKDPQKAEHVLRGALDLFLQDYVTMRENYTKRADMKDLNFEEYTQKIKQEFSQIGIRIDELDALEQSSSYSNEVQNILKRIIEEKKIEIFLKEQGIEEESGIDLTLRDIRRLSILLRISQNELIKSVNAKRNLYEEKEFDYSEIWRQAVPFGDKVIESLTQGIKTDGMTKQQKIIEFFNQIGIRLEDVTSDIAERTVVNKKHIKSILKRICNEIEIENFLEEQGIEEESGIDLNLRDARRLLILGRIQQNEWIESAKAGRNRYGEIDYSEIGCQAFQFGVNVMKSLTQGIETDGMTNEVETLLKMWGLSDKELEINRIKQED